MATGVHGNRRRFCIRINLPFKQAAEVKMLDNRELGQNFHVVHLEHTLI
jgi:hypothetical protein